MLKFFPLLAAAVLALPVPYWLRTPERCCGSSRPRIRL